MIIAFAFYLTSFIASLISPFWGLVGFVCSLLLRFQDHYPQITVIKPFTLLLFGMLLSCLINKDKLVKTGWLQDKLLLALLAISVIGLVLLSPSSLFNETYLFLCSLSLYYFASRILQTPQQYLILFICMALSISYIGYIAITDVTANGDSSVYIDPRSGRWQGLGYYENSNEFGQLMITTIPFLLAVLLASKSFLLKVLSVALTAIMLFVMLKCASRTVMVTLALMVIGTFMLRGKGNIIKKLAIGGTMSVLMLVALTFLPGPIQERMETVLDAGNDESFQGRTRSWGYGFDMLSWYPLTGVGKGQWLEYHGLMPHNSYVQIMAELGIFGIFIFIWIIKVTFNQFSPILSNPKKTGPPGEVEQSIFDEKPNILLVEDQAKESFLEQNCASNENERTEDHDSFEIDNLSRSVAIATLITFSAWLFYIFLGNQGYSVWTYFYIGLCAGVNNFLPLKKDKKSENIFEQNEQ